MIADEVMTGFGRTGTAFGCEQYGTHADILACAKGISGGYLPLGAVIAHDRVLDPIRESGEPFYSGQTYSCIPLAAAVGEAVLHYIEEHTLVERTEIVGAHLKRRFEELLSLPFVGDVRGEGLFLGIEFVEDKDSKRPFDPSLMFAKRVETTALKHGLVTYSCRGTVEGTKGDHMLFSPPLTMNIEQADTLHKRFHAALVETYEQVQK